MRHLIFLIALALLTSCKTNKNIVSDKSLAVDSLAHSEHHRSIAVLDSMVRSTSFDFDTLTVSVERPSLVADAPKIIRLKAVKGRVIDRRRVYRDSVEAYNSLDTVAYHQSEAEASTEHTATTRLYSPPNGTAIYIVAIVIAGLLIYLFYRKR